MKTGGCFTENGKGASQGRSNLNTIADAGKPSHTPRDPLTGYPPLPAPGPNPLSANSQCYTPGVVIQFREDQYRCWPLCRTYFGGCRDIQKRAHAGTKKAQATIGPRHTLTVLTSSLRGL